MTFDQFVSDAHQLTVYLKTRFGWEKIYLIGHSWGAQLGIFLVQAYPQDYYAYVGVSQVISPTLAQEIGYTWLLDQVNHLGDRATLSELETLGKPPFSDHDDFVKYAGLIDRFGGGFDIGMESLAWVALQAPEYSLRNIFAWLKGASRGSGPMWE